MTLGGWLRHARVATIVLLAGVAAACGGGGGGGGAPAGSGGPGGGSSDGSTPANAERTPVRFDAPGALTAGGLLIQSLEEVSVVARLSDFAVINIAQFGLGSELFCVQYDESEVPIGYELTDNDGDGVASPGDEIAFEIGACDGYAYDVSIILPDDDPWVDSYVAGIRFVDTFPDGAVLTGSFDLEAPFLAFAPSVLRVSNLRAAYEQDDLVEEISGGMVDLASDVYSGYDVQFLGMVTSDRLDGTYTFSTIESIRGLFGLLPVFGAFELVGGDSAVRFRVADDEARAGLLELALDATGDGDFELVDFVEWTSFVLGPLFGWLPHEPPEITSLTLEPDIPHSIDEIVARFSAEDPEGASVSLRFEWNVNGTRLYGGSAISDVVTLDPQYFASGDTVEFRLIANDGDFAVSETIAATVVNSPPTISNVYIAPEMPRATQDLTVHYQAADVDQDPLTTSVRWYVNGQWLMQYNGPYLPAETIARDDFVRAVVIVADAEAAVIGEATTTILDTPPQVSFLSQPVGEIGYDELFTAIAQITDVDGDPVDDIEFRLAFGPSGMTVDPATGVVSWLDKGPMFLERMTFNFGLTLDMPGANVVTGAVDVLDPDRERALFRTMYDYAVPDEGGLLVGDFDGDGKSEILVLRDALLYELRYSDGSYRRSWAFPGLDRPRMGISTVDAGDIDDDGRSELFVGLLNTVGVLEGVRRSLRDEVLLEAGWSMNFDVLKVADLNRDGLLDIIATNRRRLRILDAATLATIWDFPEGFYGRHMAIGNVDADPALEIVFSSGSVIDGQTFVLERDFGLDGRGRIAIGDLDGDGIGEIVVSDPDAALIRGFSALSGEEIWTIPNAATGALHIADISGGPESELVVGDGEISSGFVSVYRDEGGPAPVLIAQTSAYTAGGIVAIATGDVDNDGEPEIVFAEDGPPQILTVASNDLATIEWTTASLTTPRFASMPRGADIAMTSTDPPKLINIVNFGTMGAWLVGLDPDTGAIEYGPVLGDSSSESRAIAVTDYDNDLTDEVLVLVSEDHQTTIKVVDYFTGTVEWESPALVPGSWPDAIAFGDLTGDGRDDVVAIHDDRVYAFDIFFSEQLWTAPIQNSLDQSVAVANVNGSGNAEIIIAAGNSTTVYSGDDGPFSPVATWPFGGRDIAVGDVDGNGEIEVFVLSSTTESSPNAVVYRLNGALEVQSMAMLQQPANGIAIEKSDHARVNLIVWGDPREDRVSVVDPDDGSEIWAWPFFLGALRDKDAVRYVEVDGEYRIVMTTTEGVYITR